MAGEAAVSYWPILSLSLLTDPEVFAKVNSAQFPCRFFRVANIDATNQ